MEIYFKSKQQKKKRNKTKQHDKLLNRSLSKLAFKPKHLSLKASQAALHMSLSGLVHSSGKWTRLNLGYIASILVGPISFSVSTWV